MSSCPKNFTGIWRDYLRVGVLVNVDKPLKRRMKINRSKEEGFWANFKYERMPMFCFICGVIGHSEKFCHKLFDEPLDSIIKPYGLFMRAPDRRNNKQIGARWLRDQMDQPLSRRSGENMLEEEVWSGQRNGAKITDTRMLDGEDYGENGEKIGNHVIVGGKSGKGDIIWRSLSGNQILNANDGLIVADNKRRRTQVGDELGRPNIIMGQTLLIKDVESDYVDKEGEQVMDHNMGLRDVTSTKEGDSKNGLLAGTQDGACLEL